MLDKKKLNEEMESKNINLDIICEMLDMSKQNFSDYFLDKKRSKKTYLKIVKLTEILKCEFNDIAKDTTSIEAFNFVKDKKYDKSK